MLVKTPWKINIWNPKNWRFGRWFSGFQLGWFLGEPAVNFAGVYQRSVGEISISIWSIRSDVDPLPFVPWSYPRCSDMVVVSLHNNVGMTQGTHGGGGADSRLARVWNHQWFKTTRFLVGKTFKSIHIRGQNTHVAGKWKIFMLHRKSRNHHSPFFASLTC